MTVSIFLSSNSIIGKNVDLFNVLKQYENLKFEVYVSSKIDKFENFDNISFIKYNGFINENYNNVIKYFSSISNGDYLIFCKDKIDNENLKLMIENCGKYDLFTIGFTPLLLVPITKLFFKNSPLPLFEKSILLSRRCFDELQADDVIIHSFFAK